MVTVNEAKEKIIANTLLLATEIRTLETSLGYVLVKDILASFSLPSFRQSSMDGYAIFHQDILVNGTALTITGEAKAGERSVQNVNKGEAIRIFTGAPVPDGATAVIMQEHTAREGGQVIVNEFPVQSGKNIRNVGQQIAEGAVALPGNTLLCPGAVGFLLGLNVDTVEVYKKPKVGILVTGDELVKRGDALGYGQVYESNSAMLIAALKQEGIYETEVLYAEDDLDATIVALDALSGRNDVVLASGGISVGDYDYVGKALEAVEAQTVFYKVKQKPGKPLLFARKEDTLFFALPGNPASSLVCFYEYVLPALRKMCGRQDYFLRSLQLPITHAYSFDGERDEFLKATATHDTVIPLDGQESFALRSFAVANAIIYLPVTQNVVAKGDLVEVHLLPFS
ncbi:molybdopterin molybdotransferase MoeA [Dyadobacter psychrotolerans]|uniref:Molybdopterin molybdenumtransferase n=1 Tax=Dyadobacter psychrotolerans TaxID=2541721 RepID=A0A4R5DME6_9BACT|nr:gephyrin-like molybdotransferase Glp [Dyadobacter psychrotolerans]TDE13161.1 molybdopterin molybdenumtransferase MoeA [Dyadobacter psychrotolerans]